MLSGGVLGIFEIIRGPFLERGDAGPVTHPSAALPVAHREDEKDTRGAAGCVKHKPARGSPSGEPRRPVLVPADVVGLSLHRASRSPGSSPASLDVIRGSVAVIDDLVEAVPDHAGPVGDHVAPIRALVRVIGDLLDSIGHHAGVFRTARTWSGNDWT